MGSGIGRMEYGLGAGNGTRRTSQTERRPVISLRFRRRVGRHLLLGRRLARRRPFYLAHLDDVPRQLGYAVAASAGAWEQLGGVALDVPGLTTARPRFSARRLPPPSRGDTMTKSSKRSPKRGKATSTATPAPFEFPTSPTEVERYRKREVASLALARAIADLRGGSRPAAGATGCVGIIGSCAAARPSATRPGTGGDNPLLAPTRAGGALVVFDNKPLATAAPGRAARADAPGAGRGGLALRRHRGHRGGADPGGPVSGAGGVTPSASRRRWRCGPARGPTHARLIGAPPLRPPPGATSASGTACGWPFFVRCAGSSQAVRSTSS